MTLRRAELSLGTAPLNDAAARRLGEAAARRLGEAEVGAILETAAAARLTLVDTAAGYGDAERLLGLSWPFPTPFRVATKTMGLTDGLDRLEARARRSLELMGLPRAHALLVDNADDLLGPDGRGLWTRLEKLKGEGLFQKIGVSVADCDEAAPLARRFKPDLIQLPCSLLDQRAERTGALGSLADLGVEVHLRSVFLKGLLFLPREELPPALADAGALLLRIRRMLAEAGADPLQAALAFAQTRAEASAVIVGVGSAAELRALIAASHAPVPDLDWSAFALDHDLALDPRRWLSSAA